MEIPKDTFDIQELQTLPTPPLNSPSCQDDLRLRHLGKRPLLNRSFGFMSILGFTCSVMASWEGILVTSIGGFINGGPAGDIWGFLFNWMGTLATFATIGELASMAPTAGGQYHWVAMIAPKKWKNFLSYLTAWLTLLAWQAMAASIACFLATLTQGMIVLTRPDYVSHPWHTVLLMWAYMGLAVAVNSSTSRILASFEGMALILHLAGFFCILVPLVYYAPKTDAVSVFTTFLNGGGWSSQIISVFVGLPASAGPLLGADSAVHMSEEIQSAATVVPRAILYTVVINGILAFAMVIAMFFCAGDLNAAIHAGHSLFYPFLHIFKQAVNSSTAACVMGVVILVTSIPCSVGVYATASRMIWSFSRDQGLPFSGQLVKLTKNNMPNIAILTTLSISVLVSFVVLFSAVVFNALLSLAVAALYSSYLLVCVFLLWRRWTGAFENHHDLNTMMSSHHRLVWGPWHVPEPWGTIINAIACVYLTFIWFWTFWPAKTPTTPDTMNFSVLAFGGLIIACVVWYQGRAKRFFKGPIREVG
ncbi:amino acid/polyamine transporter I [Dendryphion nanum]|uniref:Amino acid/polyamine transporter I n=1 Tax=Dendryphion nanum TaxID=256645 RepID=A0A9P9IQ77_9PLEO|nr:amino acid/polyamine transporter I [Dendryphion nanum]